MQVHEMPDHGPAIWDDVLVLGRDDVGAIAVDKTMPKFWYYLTPCCGASSKGMADYVGCRACYHPVDEALGGIPRVVLNAYGDGIPWSRWMNTRTRP